MQGLPDDPELSRMLQIEGEKAKFQSLVHNLTDQCWDKCVPDKPGNKLDSKTENCLVNCVERFLDTSTFVVKRLDAAASR
jgi:import inner membrane translocase subunit TIM8